MSLPHVNHLRTHLQLALRGRYLAAIAVICLVGPSAMSANGPSVALCTASESPVFSCAIGHKAVSVCASADLSATSGYLIYRFGGSLTNPEMSYPSGSRRPQESFAFFHDETSAHASLEQLSFSVGGYSYTVIEETAAFDPTSNGVLVKAEGKKSAFLKCNGNRVLPGGPSGLYRLRDIGLPQAKADFDYP